MARPPAKAAPEKFAKAKSRAKTKPGRHVRLTDEERARYEELANRTDGDRKYSINVPVDRPRI